MWALSCNLALGCWLKKIIRRFATNELVTVKLYLLPILRPILSRKQSVPLKIKYNWMSSRVRKGNGSLAFRDQEKEMSTWPVTQSGHLICFFQPCHCLIFLLPIFREDSWSQVPELWDGLLQSSSADVGPPALFLQSHHGVNDWSLRVKGDYSKSSHWFTLYPIILSFCFSTLSLYFPLSPLSCLFTWVQVIIRNTKYSLFSWSWSHEISEWGKE